MRHVLSLLLLLSLALAPALSHAGDQPPPGLPADDFRTPSVMASPADTGFDNSVFAIANYNGDLILLGRKLRTLVDERLPAGRKVLTWDGNDDSGQPVASGTYFYRITTDGYVQSRQMLLLK